MDMVMLSFAGCARPASPGQPCAGGGTSPQEHPSVPPPGRDEGSTVASGGARGGACSHTRPGSPEGGSFAHKRLGPPSGVSPHVSDQSLKRRTPRRGPQPGSSQEALLRPPYRGKGAHPFPSILTEPLALLNSNQQPPSTDQGAQKAGAGIWDGWRGGFPQNRTGFPRR